MQSELTRLFARYPVLKPCEKDLVAAFEILVTAYEGGGKLLICGNGGSAADSEHIVGELMKAFVKPRPIPCEHVARLAELGGEIGAAVAKRLQGALPAISLVTPLSLNTAIANDMGADMVFAQQVYSLGRPGDVLLGISTSGNAQNVIHAVTVAKAFDLKTIILTGRVGGRLAPMTNVASPITARYRCASRR